jgi:hypothetical protein
LFPGPAITAIVRPYAPPSIASASRATAAPARSISVVTGSGSGRVDRPHLVGVTTGSTMPF